MVLLMAGLALTAGCRNGNGNQQDTKLTEIRISEPMVKTDALDNEEFPGQIEPKYMTKIQPRVSGYLKKAHFKEGDKVKKDAVLFEIDPRPFEATLEQAKADKLQKQAQLIKAGNDWERAQKLWKQEPKGIAQAEYDQFKSDYDVAKANVEVSSAQVKSAELNVGFCTITAPFDGVISKFIIDPKDNVVKADTTILTYLIAPDPLYVYFNIDERTVLKMLRLVQHDPDKTILDAAGKVKIWLADQDKHSPTPFHGDLDFVDNKTDPSTGTLLARAIFHRPSPMLKPGLYCAVRLEIGKPHTCLLVSERAIGTDQGQKYVYVVKDIKKDGKSEIGKTEYRKIKIGALQNGLRVIEDAVMEDGKVIEGLLPGEKIAVTGIEKIRANKEVLILKEQPMSEIAPPVQRPVSVQPSAGGSHK
jgi:RND family efflux transporter MFP subunit